MTTAVSATWDGLTADSLARRCGVPRVEVLLETGSTLDVAHALAENGAPGGTVVLADAQRAGRGRQGRSWSSPHARGVWCTVIERPDDRRVLDLLSLRVGLYVAEGLDALAGERVLVKWPNDLLVRAGKVAGILSEARWSGASLAWVAVGVGVNVMAPDGVDASAGLLPGTRRADVLAIVVRAVRSASAADGGLSPDELERYASRDALAGRRVTAPAEGRIQGIAPSGGLVIDTPRGREEHRVGTIRFAEDS